MIHVAAYMRYCDKLVAALSLSRVSKIRLPKADLHLDKDTTQVRCKHVIRVLYVYLSVRLFLYVR